jgi:hypothetical protein
MVVLNKPYNKDIEDDKRTFRIESIKELPELLSDELGD